MTPIRKPMEGGGGGGRGGGRGDLHGLVEVDFHSAVAVAPNRHLCGPRLELRAARKAALRVEVKHLGLAPRPHHHVRAVGVAPAGDVSN